MIEVLRSSTVCNAEHDSDTRHQAKHIAAVVVCGRASPTRSESRQSNESAFDSSCMSLEFHDLALKKTLRCRRYGKSEESQKLKGAKDFMDSLHKHSYGTIV